MDHCLKAVNILVVIVASFRCFVSPLLFLSGITSNIMVFYLFYTNRPLTRYNLYPMALSIFESAVLLLNTFIDDFMGRGLYYFSNGSVNIKIDTASLATCRFFEFAESWNSFIAAYIILAFGIDRVLSISFPHQFQRDRHIYSTMLVYVGIMVVGAALNASIAADFELRHESQAERQLWLFNTTENPNKTVICTYKVHKETQYYNKVNVTVITFLIPTFLLVIINCVIIGQMVKFLHRRKKRLAVQNARKANHSIANDQCEKRIELRRVFAYLLISFLSFAFTLPFTVTVCIRAGHTSRTPRCESAVVAELSRLFNSTKDIQYACHGYTYIFFFKFFRNRLKHMWSRIRKTCCCRSEKAQESRKNDIEVSQTTRSNIQ